MENKIKLSFILLVFFLSGCGNILDTSGFFFPDDLIDSRFVQSDQWNQTNPFKTISVNSENYQLFIAGDSHIGGTVNFDKFVSESKKNSAAALVIVGDIVSGHKQGYDTLINHLPNYSQIPYFLAVGNHDLYFDGWKTFYPYFGSSTYYFTVQTPTAKDLNIVLDSGSGTLGGKQLAWLQHVLENERSKYRHCFVYSHVNFFRNRHTGSTNPLVDELYVLMDLFAQNQVDMVFSGHDHDRSTNQFGNTTYITMDALLDGFPKAGFVILSVSKTAASFDFVDLKTIN